MPWTPTAIGMREAITSAVISRLQSKMPDLATCFARDTYTSSLVGSGYGGGLTGTLCVVKGDPESDWDKVNGAVRFFVSSGAAKNGLSIESSIEYVEQAAKKNTYHTFVSGILHPTTFQYKGVTDNVIQTQTANREYALDRLQDWMDAVFNSPAYDSACAQYTLTSDIYGTGADKLKRVYAPMIFREVFMRMPGDTVGMYGVHAVVTGIASA